MKKYQAFRQRKFSPLAAAIILFLLLFFSFSAARNLFGFRSVLYTVFVYPWQIVVRSVISIPSSISSLRYLARENAELKKKLNETLPKLALLEELRAENQKLKNLLRFRERNYLFGKLAAAEVIGISGSLRLSFLEVNLGSISGVKVGMPVVAEQGLVGRIIEVFPFSSKVLLISDWSSKVAAVDQRSGETGVIEGQLSDNLIMKFVPSGADVKVGDKVATSSISTVFPAGIPIGTIARVEKKESDMFYFIEVKPFVNFSQLTEVFIVFNR